MGNSNYRTMQWSADVAGLSVRFCGSSKRQHIVCLRFAGFKKINRLYEFGHEIILFTARGSKTAKDWKDVTETQMNKWGVKYHRLIFGKPAADFYVDDKCIHIEQL